MHHHVGVEDYEQGEEGGTSDRDREVHDRTWEENLKQG